MHVNRLDRDVPGLAHVLDLSVFLRAGATNFVLRTRQTRPPVGENSVTPELPSLVQEVADAVPMAEAAPIDGKPLELEGEDDLDVFDNLLTHPRRSLGVILLTEADTQKVRLPVNERFILNPHVLAKRMQGAAYVATMPKHLTYHWTDRVGREWSAFMGAARLFRPGIRDYHLDNGREHGFWMADRIMLWEYHGERGEHAFANFLLDQALICNALSPLTHEESVPFVDTAQAHAGAETASDRDWQAPVLETDPDTQRQIANLRSQLEEVQRSAEQWEESALAARESNLILRGRIVELEHGFARATGRLPISDMPVCLAADSMPRWVRSTMAGRLVLHSRAEAGWKATACEDALPLCLALQLLARDYRDMRLREGGNEDTDARATFNRRLAEQGLTLQRSSVLESLSPSAADLMYVDWNGRREKLAWVLSPVGSEASAAHPAPGSIPHVTFFWDGDSEQVVVGALIPNSSLKA
ncbi:MAG: hypothetical protein RLY93_20285 [Sumerlaeia bacterium]